MSAIYDFEILQEGDYQTIVYKATKQPLAAMVPIMILSLLPAAIIVYLLGFDLETGLWITGFGGLALGFILFQGANGRRRGGEIKIGKGQIVTNGEEYRLEDISMISIQNKAIEASKREVVVVDSDGNKKGPGVLGVMAKNLAEVDYKVVMRYGSKIKVIAKNLGETEAVVLKDKIIELVGFRRQAIHSN
jgi:hypothetical protein